MKAVVLKRYGSPYELRLQDVPKPKPKDDEVLVKVRIRRWRDAIARSEALGAELLDDLETGRWEEKLEPFET